MNPSKVHNFFQGIPCMIYTNANCSIFSCPPVTEWHSCKRPDQVKNAPFRNRGEWHFRLHIPPHPPLLLPLGDGIIVQHSNKIKFSKI